MKISSNEGSDCLLLITVCCVMRITAQIRLLNQMKRDCTEMPNFR